MSQLTDIHDNLHTSVSLKFQVKYTIFLLNFAEWTYHTLLIFYLSATHTKRALHSHTTENSDSLFSEQLCSTQLLKEG